MEGSRGCEGLALAQEEQQHAGFSSKRVSVLFSTIIDREPAEGASAASAQPSVSCYVWFEGTVVGEAEDGKCSVHFDDGDEAEVPVRRPEMSEDSCGVVNQLSC